MWIGLYRERQWSANSTSLFRYWASGQPDSGEEGCVTTAFNNSGLWSDDNCSLSFPFVCYKTSNVPFFNAYVIDTALKHTTVLIAQLLRQSFWAFDKTHCFQYTHLLKRKQQSLCFQLWTTGEQKHNNFITIFTVIRFIILSKCSE